MNYVFFVSLSVLYTAMIWQSSVHCMLQQSTSRASRWDSIGQKCRHCTGEKNDSIYPVHDMPSKHVVSLCISVHRNFLLRNGQLS